MESALSAIGSILDELIVPFKERISLLECEKKDLQERLERMNELLQEKERECEETISVLQRKTEQWAQIKAQLSKYKSLRSLFPPDTSFNTEAESMEVETESLEQTQLIPDAPMDEPTIAACGNEGANIAIEPFPPVNYSNNYASPLENTQLNYLADLVEDDANEVETEIEAETEKENVTDSFNFRPLLGVTKRKGHKRGCPCCEKYYQATRSPPSITKGYLQEAYDRADAHEDISSTPPGFWDVNFTPRV